MPVFLDLTSASPYRITVKILPGPGWAESLEKIKNLPERKYDSKTKLWHVPWQFFLDIQESLTCVLSPRVQDLYFALLKHSSDVRVDGDPIESDHEFTICPKVYQRRYALTHLAKTRTLCAFEQGVGKSFSSLERIKVLGWRPGKRLLLICPKAVADVNWPGDIQLILNQTPLVYKGTKKQRAKIAAQLPQNDITVTTFEFVEELNQSIAAGGLSYDFVIIDEAHIGSKPGKKKFEAISELVYMNLPDASLQCLTGTPMQHRISDIWGIGFLLDPFCLGSYTSFCHAHEKITKTVLRGGKPRPSRWEPVDMEGLREKLGRIWMRVRRDEITTFEDVTESIVVPLTIAQRRVYEQMAEAILVDFGNRELDLQHAPVRLLRLLQAAEGLFNFDPASRESGKLDYLISLLEETDEKIIVWSRFKPITEILGTHFADRAVVYNGSRTDNQKFLAKVAFNGSRNDIEEAEFARIVRRTDFPFAPGEAQFFFGTIDMRASLGMNLHRDCSRQIFTSFSWMGTANMQAADRIRRIGQDADLVLTQYLVAERTFEKRALEIVMSNYNKTLNALDGKKEAFKKISSIIEILKSIR